MTLSITICDDAAQDDIGGSMMTTSETMLDIAIELWTQDNMGTDNPMFLAQEWKGIKGWHTVQPFMTRKGAEDYIASNAHNLPRTGPDGKPKTRVWCSATYGNPEMQAVRSFIKDLIRPTTDHMSVAALDGEDRITTETAEVAADWWIDRMPGGKSRQPIVSGSPLVQSLSMRFKPTDPDVVAAFKREVVCWLTQRVRECLSVDYDPLYKLGEVATKLCLPPFSLQSKTDMIVTKNAISVRVGDAPSHFILGNALPYNCTDVVGPYSVTTQPWGVGFLTSVSTDYYEFFHLTLASRGEAPAKATHTVVKRLLTQLVDADITATARLRAMLELPPQGSARE